MYTKSFLTLISLAFIISSCSEQPLNLELNSPPPLELSVSKEDLKKFIKSRTSEEYLSRHDEICLLGEPPSTECFTQQINASISVEGTFYEECFDDYQLSDIPVTYLARFCVKNGRISDVTIFHIDVDYDYASICNDVIDFPSDPAQLETILIDFERIIGQRIENNEVQIIIGEGTYQCGTSEILSVTRVATSCFQFCLIPMPDNNGLFGPAKLICPTDVCCFQNRTYCVNEDGEIEASEPSQWSTGTVCKNANCNGRSAGCAHDCGIIF